MKCIITAHHIISNSRRKCALQNKCILFGIEMKVRWVWFCFMKECQSSSATAARALAGSNQRLRFGMCLPYTPPCFSLRRKIKSDSGNSRGKKNNQDFVQSSVLVSQNTVFYSFVTQGNYNLLSLMLSGVEGLKVCAITAKYSAFTSSGTEQHCSIS